MCLLASCQTEESDQNLEFAILTKYTMYTRNPVPGLSRPTARTLGFELNWGHWDVSFLSEAVAQFWLDPLRGFWGCWKTFIKHFFQYINSFMPFLASEGCFWPLTASITLEVKNDHAYVITQGICNKFIEVNFCVGCMVSQQNYL